MRNTKNFKNNELDSNFSYHRWIWYVYGYLSLARIGVEKLETPRHYHFSRKLFFL